MNERPHKKLKIWHKIITLVKEIYILTKKFPKEEIYGLISQMRRSVISIASNLAEGSARKGTKEKIQFYLIARGSLSELDAQVEISAELEYIQKHEYVDIEEKIDEISRMLQGLIQNYEKT